MTPLGNATVFYLSLSLVGGLLYKNANGFGYIFNPKPLAMIRGKIMSYFV